jgi:hypothetical protein
VVVEKAGRKARKAREGREEDIRTAAPAVRRRGVTGENRRSLIFFFFAAFAPFARFASGFLCLDCGQGRFLLGDAPGRLFDQLLPGRGHGLL